MTNVNDSYFDGHYKDIWKQIIPAELTTREVDFMLTWFNLQPGSNVLDLMCGHGRHALALARKGMNVTAIDNLADYTSELTEQAEKEQLPLRVIRHDVISYSLHDHFNLALCMGNSLNFFDAKDTSTLLQNVARHLEPGGHLLINSWSLAETIFTRFEEKGGSKVGDIQVDNHCQLLFHPTRMETETKMTNAKGEEEIKIAIDYIFSVNEMESMLRDAGLELEEIFSIPGRKKFTLGEPRAYIIAKKTGGN